MTGAMKGRLLQWSHFNGIFLFFSLSLSLFFFWLSELTTSTLSCFVPTSPNLVRLWGFGSPPHTHRSSHRVHFGIPKLSTSLPYKSRVQLSGASHMEGVKDISSYLVRELTQNVTQAVQQTQYDSIDISAVTDDLSHFKPTKSIKAEPDVWCKRRQKKKRKNIHIVMLPLFTASLMINPCSPEWNIPVTTGCIHN